MELMLVQELTHLTFQTYLSIYEPVSVVVTDLSILLSFLSKSSRGLSLGSAQLVVMWESWRRCRSEPTGRSAPFVGSPAVYPSSMNPIPRLPPSSISLLPSLPCFSWPFSASVPLPMRPHQPPQESKEKEPVPDQTLRDSD